MALSTYLEMTGGGLTGDSDLTPSVPSMSAGGLITDKPSKNALAPYGTNAASRWSGGSSSSEYGFTPSSAGTVMGEDASHSQEIKDWKAASQARWEEQKRSGMTSYVSPEEEVAQQERQKAAPAPKTAPGQNIEMPGLHGFNTYEGRAALAKAGGWNGNDYLRVFGHINARPTKIIKMSESS